MKMFDADKTRMIRLPCGEKNYDNISVVTIASEPVSIDYDRSFEKNRDVDVDVDSMLHGHVD